MTLVKKVLNPEKSQQLRPLRIILAILIVILVILVLDRLPTSVKNRETTPSSSTETRSTAENLYFFSGLLEALESQTRQKLLDLGVPEEEFKNATEYLSKDDIYEIEAKATLAANLESVYVEAETDELARLRQIFDLPESYTFTKATFAPSEYKSLHELLGTYDKTLNTVEDYDIIEE